jgi:mRNA interferase MazF
MRGDLVTIAISGDYGKPRPALIVQSDAFVHHPSVIVLPLTSEILPLRWTRVLVKPSSSNGLLKESQIMVDKAIAIPRQKIGTVIGKVEATIMAQVDRALLGFLGLNP